LAKINFKLVCQKLILDGLPKISFKMVWQKLTLSWFAKN
jgi:hypothetical protein